MTGDAELHWNASKGRFRSLPAVLKLHLFREHAYFLTDQLKRARHRMLIFGRDVRCGFGCALVTDGRAKPSAAQRAKALQFGHTLAYRHQKLDSGGGDHPGIGDQANSDLEKIAHGKKLQAAKKKRFR